MPALPAWTEAAKAQLERRLKGEAGDERTELTNSKRADYGVWRWILAVGRELGDES